MDAVSRKNLTASANDLEWNGKKMEYRQSFHPAFTEEEVNAPDRFESDFMVRYMADKKFSDEAKAVLAEGKKTMAGLLCPHRCTQCKGRAETKPPRCGLVSNKKKAPWYAMPAAIFHLFPLPPLKPPTKHSPKSCSPWCMSLGF